MTNDLEPKSSAHYAEAVRSEYETDLKQFVDIASVSADPAHKNDINLIAQKAVTKLKDFGATAEIIQTSGNPIVYGHFSSGTDNQNPTVLVYNHLDVQPADSADWSYPPFEMRINQGVYCGRGTTDDKGPALAILYAAKYAHDHHLPLNIKFIWELEEEIGSPSFHAALTTEQARFSTNSIVVSDTIWVSRSKPAIPYGLRGLQGATIRLTTGKKDVHSGTTGGAARNPIGELCQLINDCYDAKTGQVKIPGFYDDAVKPSSAEVKHFLDSGFNLNDFCAAHELKSIRTNDTADAAQRLWAAPTFEVHGIVGGYTGPGIKTIIPHSAEAKISMRLVPNQTPAKILRLLEDFVKQNCPDAVVTTEGSLSPYLGKFNGPYYAAASQAMEEAFGKKAAFTREGGSIGAVESMHQLLQCPIVFLGLSLPEHGYHAINENFDWQQASGGIKLFIEYFKSIAKLR